MGYQLAPGLSFCTTDGKRVFLDIRRDRYFCLSPEPDDSFGRLAGGGVLEEADLRRLEGLVEQNVLRPHPTGTRIAPCASVATPARSLFAAGGSPTLGQTMRALLAFHAARWQLRRIGLYRSLDGLARRKRRLTPMPAAEVLAEEVARAFRQAAGLATTWNHCLAHSLAVASALTRRGVAADLILGVHMGPFMAHAWVQFGDAVVNDRVDTVRDFTPVLVV